MLFSSPVAIFAQETTWESTIEGARKALNEHRLADAAQLFLQASKEAEQFGPEDVRLAEVLDGLASVYRVYLLQHKFAQAEPVEERGVKVCEKVYGADHFETWLAKRHLATLYRIQGKDAKAEPLLRQNVEVAEKRFGPQGAPLAESLVQLAEVYVNQSEDDQAEPLYQRALAIWEKSEGPEYPQMVLWRFSLAEIYHRQGRLAEAEPLYQRGLAFFDQQVVRGGVFLSILEGYAALLRTTGREAEAEELTARAKSLRASWQRRGFLRVNCAELERLQAGPSAVGPKVSPCIASVTE